VVLTASAVTALVLLRPGSGQDAVRSAPIADAFVGYWGGDIDDASGLAGAVALEIHDKTSSSGGDDRIETSIDLVGQAVSGEHAKCLSAYDRQDVSDQELVLKGHLVGGPDSQGPGCKKFLDAMTVTIDTANAGSLQIRWDDRGGRTASALLTRTDSFHSALKETPAATPGSTATPIGPVPAECRNIDAGRLEQVFGKEKRTPEGKSEQLQPGAPDELSLQSCTRWFTNGGKTGTYVGLDVLTFRTPEQAQQFYASWAKDDTGTVSKPPVPLGDRAFQSSKDSPLANERDYRLAVVAANRVVRAYVPHDRGFQDDAVAAAVGDVAKGMLAGLK
ncbi:hypothetical protein, partial [Kitasatospora sp. NPDC093558]|uniref:hypothetical protein n=1 Tax=Kitasatospora sp. NPDC093558 TaxID=3155201 RepID=UPI0034219BC3